MKIRLIFVLFCAGTTIALAGCGGGGGNSGSPLQTPTNPPAIPPYIKPLDGITPFNVTVTKFNDGTTHYAVNGTQIEPTDNFVAYLSRQQPSPLNVGLVNNAKTDLTVAPPKVGYDAYVVPEVNATNTGIAFYLVDGAGNPLSGTTVPEVVATSSGGHVSLAIAGAQPITSAGDASSLISVLNGRLPIYSAVSADGQYEETDAVGRYVAAYITGK